MSADDVIDISDDSNDNFRTNAVETAGRNDDETAERNADEAAARSDNEAAEQNGVEAAARNGQEAATRNGVEAAERNGDEPAERNGDKAAERNGDETAERNGDEATERNDVEAAEQIGDEVSERSDDEATEGSGDEATERSGDEATERSDDEATSRSSDEMSQRTSAEEAERDGDEEAERNGDEAAEQNATINLIDEVSLADFSIIRLMENSRMDVGTNLVVRKIGGVDNKKIYAMKIVTKESIYSKYTEAFLTTERKILEAIIGKSLLSQLVYAFETEVTAFFVMEYIGNRNLAWFLNTSSTLYDARFYIAQMILALDSLHELNVVFRKVNMNNIKIDLAGNLTLADFTISRYVHTSDEGNDGIVGPWQYLAPEIFLALKLCTTDFNILSDWWAVGVLTFEMIYGGTPFYFNGEDGSFEGFAYRIINRNAVFTGCLNNYDAHDFITSLLLKNPHNRLGSGPNGVMDIKNHSFFSGINWEDLKEKRLRPPYKPIDQYAEEIQNFNETLRLNLDDVMTVQVPILPLQYLDAFEFVRSDILKANRYYRLMNDRDGEKIEKPVVPDTINDLPATEESVEFMEQNAAFFEKYRFTNPLVIENGAYSVCLHCVNIKTTDKFACKILNSNLSTTNNEIEKLLKCQGHPNVVNLIDAFVGPKLTFIVMELLNGGNLLDRFANQLPGEIAIYDIMKQIIEVIEFIHGHNVVHCDINLRNFLFTGPYETTIKLIDFGSAIYVDRECPKNYLKPTFTLECTAPEIIQMYERELDIIERNVENDNNDGNDRSSSSSSSSYSDDNRKVDAGRPSTSKDVYQRPTNEHKCSKESDIWSIGIIFYRLMCDEYPFFSLPFSYNEIRAQIFAGEIISNCYSDRIKFSRIDRTAKSLFYQLTHADAKLRINIPAVRVSDWYCTVHDRISAASLIRTEVIPVDEIIN